MIALRDLLIKPEFVGDMAILRFAGYCGTRGPVYLSRGEQKDGGLQKTRKPQRETEKEKEKKRKKGKGNGEQD